MIATTSRADTRDPLALPGAEPPAPAGPAPGTLAWTPLLIAADHCKGCSLCIGACASGALALDTDRVNALGYHPIRLARASACTSCALCARVCPDCVFTVLAPPRATRAPRAARATTLAVPVDTAGGNS